MIVTVTMNPAVDRTVSIESLHRGGLNRIQKAESDAGGKGINVSKTLKVLGADSTATGFLAGTAGKKIEEQLKIQGIQTDFLWIGGETRTNTKVQEIGGCVTEFNEPGPEVSEVDRHKLLEKLEDYAGENVLFVAAGNTGFAYVSTQRLDSAFEDRFIKVQLDYLTPEEEAELILLRYPAVPAKTAALLAETARVLRYAEQKEALSVSLSTRQVLDAAAYIPLGYSLKEAIEEVILTNYVIAGEQLVARSLIQIL